MSFSCVLLGETTLLRRCAALLRAQGWSIGAVASNDEGNRAWAISENILCCGLDSKLHEHLAKVSFDYLFSIVNPVVLKTEVLNLPIEGAINFHDSLLPAYAGTHATSWAILNQEIAHGISWHEISSNIDGGQVYVQVPVAIGPRMTAHQLNAACYDAALAGFETLLAQIQSKSLQGLDQDRSQRSYFGRYEGPPDGGFIRWSKSAKELDALVRSTDFGPSDNTFGSAKLLLPDAAIVVVEATADGHSSHPPGTIVGCVHSLSVSTGHGLLRISRLRSLDGAELTVEQFVREYGLSQGAVLPVLSDVEAKKYRKSHNAAAKIEATWINSVADIEIPKFFFASSDRTGVAVDGQSDSISLLSPLKFDDWSDQYEVAARVCLFLRRLVRIDSFDVGFFSERESCCFAPSLPLRVNVSLSETIDCALARLKTAWEAIGKTKGLLLDSLMRYRATRSESSLQTLCNFPVVFAFTTSQNIEAVKSQLVPVSPLLAVIISDDGTVNFAWNRLGSRGYDRARFNELAQAFLVDIQLHSDEALENVPWRNDISVNSERPGVARSRDLTFLDYFSASVSRFSNSVAMTFDGVSLNYCELDVDSTRLAVELQRLGVTKGSRVAVFVQRSHRMIVAMLAILKAGASYVPMDTAVPEDRTRSILEDCVPQVVIADSTTEPALSFSGLTILVLDREPDSKSEMSLQSFGASSEEEAYLLYTSGSTGRPKGVVVTHGNLAAFIAAALPNYQNTSGRPMIAQLSIAFDASLAEIVLPLSCGGSLAVFSRETVTDTLQFRDHLEKGDYHFLITVPSQVRALLEAGWTGRGVRGVNIGGEPLTHELSKRLFSVKPPELRVVNMYGPTETTIGITRYELETAGMYEESSLTEPIGLPLDGAQLRIVDEGLRALPWGVPGEILLGGEFVAAGYLGAQT